MEPTIQDPSDFSADTLLLGVLLSPTLPSRWSGEPPHGCPPSLDFPHDSFPSLLQSPSLAASLQPSIHVPQALISLHCQVYDLLTLWETVKDLLPPCREPVHFSSSLPKACPLPQCSNLKC